MDIARKPAKSRRRWVYGSIAFAGVPLAALAPTRIGPAAPPVERGTVWTDTVRRGDRACRSTRTSPRIRLR